MTTESTSSAVTGVVIEALAEAAQSAARTGSQYRLIDLKLYYIEPVTSVDQLRVRTEVLHAGRSTAIIECSALDSAQRVVAFGAGTFKGRRIGS